MAKDSRDSLDILRESKFSDSTMLSDVTELSHPSSSYCERPWMPKKTAPASSFPLLEFIPASLDFVEMQGAVGRD
jgi:hypothetical protein